MNLSWFRVYAEAIDDDKLRLLAFEDRWHFIALLCLKTQGILDGRDEPLRRRRMAIKMGLDLPELETVMGRLETVGLVSSRWQPLAWKNRQFVSDSSTKRVRAFRKRSRNVPETPQSRAEQIQNRAEAEPSAAHWILECPRDMDSGLEHRAFCEWCGEKNQVPTYVRWRRWVLRAKESGRYAKTKPRPPTDEEVQAERRKIIAAQEAQPKPAASARLDRAPGTGLDRGARPGAVLT